MTIQWQLCPNGPWMPNGEPLVYANGAYGYASNPSFNAEQVYLAGKLAVITLISNAVDAQLPALTADQRNSIIDAICDSWVTKVNMAMMYDGTPATSLKIPLNAGGLEVRADGSIHYWTDNHQDLGSVNALLTAQIRVLVGKVHTAVTAAVPNVARAVMVERMILKDVFDQFVVNIT